MKNNQNDKIYIPQNIQILDQLNKKQYQQYRICKNNQNHESATLNFQKLVSLIDTHYQLIVIHSESMVGKTTFLQMILESLIQFKKQHNQQFRHLLINFQEYSAIQIQEVLGDLIIQNNAPQQLLDINQEQIPLMLLLDQFEESFINRNSDQILTLLNIFIRDKKSQIFLTIHSDAFDSKSIIDWIAKYQNALIIQLMPFEEDQVIEFFNLFQAKILGDSIYNLFKENEINEIPDWQIIQNDINRNFFFNEEAYPTNLTITKLIQAYYSKINFQEMKVCLEDWNKQQVSFDDFKKIIADFNLHELVRIPGIFQIIAFLMFQKKLSNQYKFYSAMIKECIFQNATKKQYHIDEKKFLKSQLQYCSKLASNFPLNSQKNESYWIKFLMKHQDVKCFFIACFFDEQFKLISDLCESHLNHKQMLAKLQESQKIAFSILGEINFLSDNFSRVSLLLSQKYLNSQDELMWLINTVKSSAISQNLEKVASNAMIVLSKMKVIIKNQDFSHIRLSNTSMDYIQFFKCNFNNSIINNVIISYTQFIDCTIEDAKWNNIESCLASNLSEYLIVEFSNSKSILFVMNTEGLIFIVNFYTRKPIKFLFFYDEEYPQLQQLCQGSVILTCPFEYSIFSNQIKKSTFWNHRSQKKIRVCRGKGFFRNQFYFSKDRSTNLELIKRFNLDQSSIKEVIYTRDQSYFAFAKNSTIYIINNKGEQQREISVNGEIQQQIFSPDGSKLVFIVNCTLFVWYIKEQYVQQILNNHQNKIHQISIFNNYIISKSKFNRDTSREINLWRIMPKNEKQELKFLSNVESIVKSKDFNIVAQTYYDGKIEFTRINDHKVIKTLSIGEACMASIIISPNWQTFVSVNQKAQIFLWSLEDGKKILQFQQVEEKGFQIIQFSPDGKYLACQPFYQQENFLKIFIWTVNDGKLINYLHEQNMIVKFPFRFSYNGEQIVIPCQNGLVYFNVEDDKIISIPNSQYTSAFAFSSNEKFIVCGSELGDIILIQYPQKMKSIETNDAVTSICLSPDDRLIVSSHASGFVRIFSIAAYRVTMQFLQIPQNIANLIFSSDGKLLAMGFKDDTIQIWKLQYHNNANDAHLTLQSWFGLSHFRVQNCSIKQSKFDSFDNIHFSNFFQKQSLKNIDQSKVDFEDFTTQNYHQYEVEMKFQTFEEEMQSQIYDDQSQIDEDEMQRQIDEYEMQHQIDEEDQIDEGESNSQNESESEWYV